LGKPPFFENHMGRYAAAGSFIMTPLRVMKDGDMEVKAMHIGTASKVRKVMTR